MNPIKISIVLCLLLSTRLSYAEPNANDKSLKQYHYRLSFDRHFSSKSSSELASSIFERYRQLEESLNFEPTRVTRFLLFLTRLKTAEFIVTANHEIGGHGAVLRALGAKSIRYSVGLNGGSTWYRLPSDTHLHDRLMVHLGGMNASNLLSEITQQRFLEESTITSSLSHLYWASKFDQINYIFSCKSEGSKNPGGHDVSNYIQKINVLYQTNHLSSSKLKKYNYWGLLDPFLAYAIYSSMTDNPLTLPLINLNIPGVYKPVGFLPSAQLLLTPYGPELGIRNSIRVSDRNYQLTLLHGKNPPFNTYGISIGSDQWLHYQKFTIGGEVRLWSQPQLLAAGNFTEAPKKTGGMLTVNTQFPVNKTITLYASLGYKTAGFALGESLKKGAILKTGIAIRCGS
jgi:hypothetical protein